MRRKASSSPPRAASSSSRSCDRACRGGCHPQQVRPATRRKLIARRDETAPAPVPPGRTCVRPRHPVVHLEFHTGNLARACDVFARLFAGAPRGSTSGAVRTSRSSWARRSAAGRRARRWSALCGCPTSRSPTSRRRPRALSSRPMCCSAAGGPGGLAERRGGARRRRDRVVAAEEPEALAA